MIPDAISRPPVKSNKSGKVTRRHQTMAHHALALTRGDGAFVVLHRNYSNPGKMARRVAKAWNRMLDDAEIRHKEFWEDYDAS